MRALQGAAPSMATSKAAPSFPSMATQQQSPAFAPVPQQYPAPYSPVQTDGGFDMSSIMNLMMMMMVMVMMMKMMKGVMVQME